ncbi:P-loop NTPase fold protein [Lactococcus petauri]|uniref:P-loop NTPase fold protein n=1 Tax=Lactococcus petauri TaxID=1940789 RepID=UPI003853278C
MKKIEYQTIEYSEANKRLSDKLLNEPGTYFLNGKWGSGKSTFFEKTAKTHNIKFIEFNIWAQDSRGSLFGIVFRKIYNKLFWTSFTLIISGILLISFFKVVPIEDARLSIIIAGLLAIGILCKYFLPKPDNLYLMLLNTLANCSQSLKSIALDYYPNTWFGAAYIKKIKKKQTVIVFDDFDRADEKKQNQAYIIFNLLQKNKYISILFIGDYLKISKINDSFIRKIIDEVIDLPIELDPKEIWTDFFSQLTLLTPLSDEDMDKALIDLFIIEERNLRDRKQFTDYVNYELFTLKLYDKVNLNQKLLLIYLYVFHYEKYLKIKSGKLTSLTSNNASQDINGIISKILSNEYSVGHTFPRPFDYDNNNLKNYFMHQNPNNFGLTDARKIILENKQKLVELITMPEHTDFREFTVDILNSGKTESTKKLRDILEEQAKKLFHENKEGLILQDIIYSMVKPESSKILKNNQEDKDINYKNRELLFQDTIHHFVNNRTLTDISHQILKIKKEIVGQTEKYKFDTNNFNDLNITDFMILVGYFWKSIFKKYKITQPSRQIIFLKKWCDYSYENVAKMCKPLPLKEIKKEGSDDRITFLLHYMAFNDLWYSFKKWDNSIWEIVDELSPKQFISFWDSQSMLHITLSGKSVIASVRDWTPLNPNTLEDVELAKKNIIKHKDRLKNNIYIKANNEADQIRYIEA